MAVGVGKGVYHHQSARSPVGPSTALRVVARRPCPNTNRLGSAADTESEHCRETDGHQTRGRSNSSGAGAVRESLPSHRYQCAYAGVMQARSVVAVVLGVCAMLTACSSNIEGTATRGPDSFAEPEFPTPRPTRPDPSPPPTTANPRPAPSPTPAPGGEVLSPQNGYVFIETKSGPAME